MMQIIARNLILSALFFSLIIFIQLNQLVWIGIWCIFAFLVFYLCDKDVRNFIFITFLFGIGFYGYLFANSQFLNSIESIELYTFLRRFTLCLILFPFFIFSIIKHEPFVFYNSKPLWNASIAFPFVWSGFHQIKVKYFLVIALSVNILSFMPFILKKDLNFIQEIFVLALIFSITNAILEELVWRGVLLGHFSKIIGEKWAVIITSIGFGLQHYSLGFSWITSLAFSIGGFYYAGLVVKSKSIIPAIMWHIFFNILMVLSGLILNS